MTNEISQLFSKSQKILITSHISTDPDAFCSSLLLARTLQENYPDKTILAVLEEEPTKDLGFLEGARAIKFANLYKEISSFKPDLLIMVDANQYKRCSRDDFEYIEAFVAKNKVKAAIIDHHQPVGASKVDLYIRRDSPATCQLLYELLFEELGLKMPAGYAPIALLGILTDTIRFKLGINDYAKTFSIVTKLIADGADIEELENKITHFDGAEIKTLGHLADNLTVDAGGFNYSYISDDFYDPKEDIAIKSACQLFVNEFIRNIDKNSWGFLVRPEGQGFYAVSFRAKKGVINVSEVAAKLGGGGHIGAAAARVEARSVKETIKLVKTAINTLA